jgi:phage N-6-adenine-methyltransferase
MPEASREGARTMNTALMFSSKSDEWSTPQDTYDRLDDEFGFAVDMAASAENTKCAGYFGPDGRGLCDDGLAADFRRALRAMEDGTGRSAFWCNPPYSRGLQGKFIAKAAEERRKGFLTVMLLPARTDTKAFHAHVYDAATWSARPGVEIRLLPGRLKFGGCKDAAPFPSMVIIFRPQQ